MIEIDFNMEKEFEEFYLKTKDEVEVFQNFISEYLRSKNIMSLPNLDLLSIFDACNGKKNGERIFAMMLDIKINFILIWLDQNDAGAIWNQNFSKGKLEGGSVLDSRSKFYGKFEIHRFNSSFIFRYRAIWDKIMGVLVLLMLPADYNSFMGSKSKKKAFLKLSKKGSPLTEEFETIHN